MAGAARLTDALAGETAGEHCGHLTPHDPGPITGTISGGCSDTVYVDGLAAATVGSITTEIDACCGGSAGSVAKGSASVYINGKAAARTGDALAAHNGTGSISGGSTDVQIGG